MTVQIKGGENLPQFWGPSRILTDCTLYEGKPLLEVDEIHPCF